MPGVDHWAGRLCGLTDEAALALLDRESGLPGPRGNIELGQAFADWAAPALIWDEINHADEYRRFCGALGLGRIIADGDSDPALTALCALASDPSWRVREGVAMALQRIGDADPVRMRLICQEWSRGPDPLLARAGAAGICEPRLLSTPDMAAGALTCCASATAALVALPAPRRSDDARALRKGLGYCWSVAIAADPEAGLPAFADLESAGESDVDVAWIVRENRKKNRLARLLD